MTGPTPAPPAQRKWLDWQPGPNLLGPTAPQPSSVGFDGATPACSTKVQCEDELSPRRPNQPAINRAVALMNACGGRLMSLNGILTVGLWRDMHGPEVRLALRVLEMDGLRIRWLEDVAVPQRYKVRRVHQPDQLIPWAEWRAEALNRIFKEQGVSGERGRIKSETVASGEASIEQKRSRHIMPKTSIR